MSFLTKLFPNLFGQKRLTTQAAYQFLGTTWHGRGTYSNEKLADLYRRNELAYACIQKIAEVMNDAELIVERKNKKGEWEKIEGHPLAAMMKKPNSQEIGLDFRKKMCQSEYSLGIVYIRLVRPRPSAVPTEFYVLNPNRIMPQINYSTGRIGYFQYTNPLGHIVDIAPENMLIRRRADLTDEFYGLAPLQVAANTIEADENLTEYINSFFDGEDGNAGVPAGILKFTSTLSKEQAELKRKLWLKNTRGNEIQVVDQNADYQPVASKMSELGTDSLTARNEAKILGIFGVPGSLVSAYVSYLHVTQNATAKSELNNFYLNKISPELKNFREWATWEVLPLFEDINLIKQEKIRVGWDLSQMAAWQVDLTEIHTRARADFQAGGITLNEFRSQIKQPPDPKGDYYLQPFNLSAISPENRAAEAVRKVEQGTNPDDVADSSASDEEEKTAIQGIPEPLLLPEKKTFEFDGLELSREPNEIEKLIDLKSLVSDLETQSESLESSLLKYRDVLINQAVSLAKDLDEKNIFTLTLDRNEKAAKVVKKSLNEAYGKGRAQIVREINAQKSFVENPFLDEKYREKLLKEYPINFVELKDLLDDDAEERLASLSDSVISKMLNEIQSRTVNIFTALKVLGWETVSFFDEMKKRLAGESTAFVTQTAKASANAAIMTGRSDEISEQSENWDRIQYSAILDKNTCPACKKEDGKEASDESELEDVPNPFCDGGSLCRCFHVVVLD